MPLLMVANLLAAGHKGVTAGEFYHVPAGHYHLTADGFPINTGHPPQPFALILASGKCCNA